MEAVETWFFHRCFIDETWNISRSTTFLRVVSLGGFVRIKGEDRSVGRYSHLFSDISHRPSCMKLAPYPETRPLRFRTLFSHHPCMACTTCIWLLRIVGKYTIYGSYGFQISLKFIFWRIVRVTTMTDTAVILWVCITVHKDLFMRPLQGLTFLLDFSACRLSMSVSNGTLTECGIFFQHQWCGSSIITITRLENTFFDVRPTAYWSFHFQVGTLRRIGIIKRESLIMFVFTNSLVRGLSFNFGWIPFSGSGRQQAAPSSRFCFHFDLVSNCNGMG